MSQNYMRRRAGERYYQHCVDQTVKHGGKIIECCCLSGNYLRRISRIHRIMDKNVYKGILVEHAKPNLQFLGAPVFLQDNDPKHKARINMEYLKSDSWPAEVME